VLKLNRIVPTNCNAQLSQPISCGRQPSITRTPRGLHFFTWELCIRRSAIFRADGTAYALHNHATNEGYANIAPLLKPGRDVGPILQMALALCD